MLLSIIVLISFFVASIVVVNKLKWTINYIECYACWCVTVFVFYIGDVFGLPVCLALCGTVITAVELVRPITEIWTAYTTHRDE